MARFHSKALPAKKRSGSTNVSDPVFKGLPDPDSESGSRVFKKVKIFKSYKNNFTFVKQHGNVSDPDPDSDAGVFNPDSGSGSRGLKKVKKVK